MRKSQIRKTPDKSKTLSKSSLTSPQSAPRVYSQLYYCHYKNAMYMGGIRSFKKEGRGIMLHDNGVSMLTSYYNDLLHGHNILFDNYCLLSAIFNKNKIVQAAFRTQGFLVFLNYNQQKQLQGNIKLVNFITKSIAYATFRKGVMIDKNEEREITLLNRVFQLGQLEFIVGRTHAKIFKYQFEKFPNIEIIKQANKLIVGFEKNGFINGLGFQFVYRGSQGGYNPDTHRHEDDFQLRMIERGYYISTQLNGMGSKVFKNGNWYLGEFKNGLFDGNGILKNSQKKNWVSGYFKGGNLAQLLQYNSDGQYKSIDRIVEALHERKTNWINNQITPFELNFYVDQIERIITTQPSKNVYNLEQRKQEVLRKIQEKFIADNNQSFSAEADVSNHNFRNNSAGNSSIAKFINNLSPADTSRQAANSDVKRKLYINSKEESKRFDNQSGDKKSKSNFAKIKIFQRSATSKSPVKVSHLEQSRFNKRFVHSPGWIKGNDAFSSRKSESEDKVHQQQEAESTGKVRHPLSKTQFSNSRQLRVEPAPASGSYSLSSQQVSFSNKNPLDSKRLVAKSKIFKYLQSQQPSDRSPQFNDKIYTLESTQRRKDGRSLLEKSKN